MVEPKYQIKWTSQYKKDIKLAKKRHYKIEELQKVVFSLANALPLDEKYHDHELEGNWKNHRECHIKPDWLLIYQIKDDVLILELSRTGTHADLFKKRKPFAAAVHVQIPERDIVNIAEFKLKHHARIHVSLVFRAEINGRNLKAHIVKMNLAGFDLGNPFSVHFVFS